MSVTTAPATPRARTPRSADQVRQVRRSARRQRPHAGTPFNFSPCRAPGMTMCVSTMCGRRRPSLAAPPLAYLQLAIALPAAQQLRVAPNTRKRVYPASRALLESCMSLPEDPALVSRRGRPVTACCSCTHRGIWSEFGASQLQSMAADANVFPQLAPATRKHCDLRTASCRLARAAGPPGAWCRTHELTLHVSFARPPSSSVQHARKPWQLAAAAAAPSHLAVSAVDRTRTTSRFDRDVRLLGSRSAAPNSRSPNN